MKKMIMLLGLLILSLGVFAQNFTKLSRNRIEADTLKANYWLIINGDTLHSLNPTEGQFLKFVGGKYVNSDPEALAADSMIFDKLTGILKIYKNGLAALQDTLDGRYVTYPDLQDTLSLKYMSKAEYDPANIASQVVGTTSSQTLTNKTLVIPTIANFTSAQHDHSSASQGGAIAVAAGDVSVTPVGGVSSTNAQSAIMELDLEKVHINPASTQSGYSDLTSYKLNGTNLFGLLASNRVVYWDGSKFASITDGTNGQALTTNGSGSYSFTTVSGGSSTNTPQTLSGTTVTWDLSVARDAKITLTGNTTITITNATDGMTGTLWVTNAASVYTITFAGYANAIDPFIRLASNMVLTSGGSKSDDFTFKYNGVKLNWNGTLNRE